MYDAVLKTSGLKVADAQIKTGLSHLLGVKVLTDKSNDATLVLYDNTAGSGTELYKTQVPAANDAAPLDMFTYPIKAETGIYADVTGTGASYIVYYS